MALLMVFAQFFCKQQKWLHLHGGFGLRSLETEGKLSMDQASPGCYSPHALGLLLQGSKQGTQQG